MIASVKIIAATTSLLVQAGAGCFAPTVVSSDARQVVLKAGPWDTEGELLGRADQLCARHDKVARRTAGAALATVEEGFATIRFDCVAQSAAEAREAHAR